jgi:hypothetical protein
LLERNSNDDVVVICFQRSFWGRNLQSGPVWFHFDVIYTVLLTEEEPLPKIFQKMREGRLWIFSVCL